MDEAFKQHSRRKSGSAKNLPLSLAPLTSRLPIHDLDADEPVTPTFQSRTYLEGKSAPTTPRLLSRSSTRTRLAPTNLPKSKSAIHLAGEKHDWKQERGVVSGAATPRRRKRDDHAAGQRADSDWLLRTGALMTSEARESKGQAWLVSRASSTSLAVVRDPDSDEDESPLDRQLDRERETASSHPSRRGSVANGNLYSSPSRSSTHSRPGSRARIMETPTSDNYFEGPSHAFEDMPGPDFVNLDEQLEALAVEESILDDEAAVRRLVRRGQAGQDSWLANILGWSLFSVDEDEDSEEDSGDETDDTEEEGQGVASRPPTVRYLDRLGSPPDERIPPPTADEGGWKDAAWLLTVASRVVL